jgi:nucleotide-binding universal stress UspA family protein
MFRRILVAWDGSAVAEHAVRIARDVAERCNAPLTVASVLEVPVHAEAREDRESTVREQTAHYRDSLARVQFGPASTATALRHELLRGVDPARTIVAYAHDHGYDLIVIGRGHRGLSLRGLAHSGAMGYEPSPAVALCSRLPGHRLSGVAACACSCRTPAVPRGTDSHRLSRIR